MFNKSQEKREIGQHSELCRAIPHRSTNFSRVKTVLSATKSFIRLFPATPGKFDAIAGRT